MRTEHSCYTIDAIRLEVSSNLRMTDRKAKWLIYTVLVALIPAMARMLVWLISQNSDTDLFNAVDFIIFGLVLHISNINELEHFNEREESWKTVQNGASVFLIILYSILLTAYLFGEATPSLLNYESLKYISIGLGIGSFLISLSVYNETSRTDKEQQNAE